VGTQTTSLPACPTSGWYSLACCAQALPAANAIVNDRAKKTVLRELRLITIFLHGKFTISLLAFARVE
jgi:hypothetical protein